MAGKPEVLKIFTISLASSKRYKAYAAYNGEQLVIASITPIAGIFNSWRDGLIKEIEEKKAQGYVVLVEENTDYISQHATQYLLEDIDEEGRSNYFNALDSYFGLANMEAITFHPDVMRFAITPTSENSGIEKKNDDKGRVVYNVQWSKFHGAQRAILLCVIAALHEPVSDRYLKAMFPPSTVDDEEHPALRWRQRILEMDSQRAIELDKSRGV